MKDVATCEKLGETVAFFDPKMSEWGNPPRMRYLHLNS